MIGYSFHPFADADVLEIARFYERRSPGLGGEFRSDLTAAISLLRQQPEAAPVVRGNLRRKLLLRFPYYLIYAVENAEIRIYAVSHHKRRPNHWRERFGRGAA